MSQQFRPNHEQITRNLFIAALFLLFIGWLAHELHEPLDPTRIGALLAIGLIVAGLTVWGTGLTVDDEGIAIHYPFSLGLPALRLPWSELVAVEPGPNDTLFLVSRNDTLAVQLRHWRRHQELRQAITDRHPLATHMRYTEAANYWRAQRGGLLSRAMAVTLPLIALALVAVDATDATRHISSPQFPLLAMLSVGGLGLTTFIAGLRWLRDPRAAQNMALVALLLSLYLSAGAWIVCHHYAVARHHMITERYSVDDISPYGSNQTWRSTDGRRRFRIGKDQSYQFVYGNKGDVYDFQLIEGPFGIRDIPWDELKTLIKPKAGR